ncbi:unnamed protein product [Urochloa decumbens]|uniref:Hydroxymethylglutaryl-CoA synthase n=1 Tax=Urochloa decumbens TaxID=240449 RepID=A0ABC9BQF1_9POAL
MAFCSDVEDVISMSLTVVASLLQKYNIDPKLIGRLEVGSETVIDKSKSIKTWLMQIFEVYADGLARPIGGAAAIAMLIGPDAPISFERKYKASHMADVYDFYKPDLASEYPVVDGKLSQTCYLMALDSCYRQFCTKYEKLVGEQFSISDADYCVFHSPYNKLVQKSFTRLFYNDFMRNCSSVDNDAQEKLLPFANLTNQESYQSHDLEKVLSYLAGQRRTLLFVLDVTAKLESRHVTSPEKFVETLKLMEHRYGAKDFETSKDTSLLPPGTFYLTEVDSMYRRFYDMKASDDIAAGGKIKGSNGIANGI